MDDKDLVEFIHDNAENMLTLEDLSNIFEIPSNKIYIRLYRLMSDKQLSTVQDGQNRYFVPFGYKIAVPKPRPKIKVKYEDLVRSQSNHE